jgi:ABC-type taurine transport system ATPase subunit
MTPLLDPAIQRPTLFEHVALGVEPWERIVVMGRSWIGKTRIRRWR